MISDIMNSAETVRVLDFFIYDPFSEYNKTEIAEGSFVSRPTVQRIVEQLLRLGMLKVTAESGNANLFELNLKSPLVKSLISFTSELSKALVDAKMDSISALEEGSYNEDFSHEIDAEMFGMLSNVKPDLDALPSAA